MLSVYCDFKGKHPYSNQKPFSNSTLVGRKGKLTCVEATAKLIDLNEFGQFRPLCQI